MKYFHSGIMKLTFLSKSKLYIPTKIHVSFLTCSLRLCYKKKFNISNSFTFQDKFRKEFESQKQEFENQQQEFVKASNHRIVSMDLLNNEDKFIRQKNKFPVKQKEKRPSLKYQGEILFGVHPVYLALMQKKRIFHHLYIRKSDSSDESCNETKKEEIIKLSKSMDIPISYIDSRGLNILTSNAVHQGVCLDAGFLPVPVWDNQTEYWESEEKHLWLVLDEILDPMNVGAVIRSAYYFGVNKLFVVKGNSCKLSPTVSKASSGSLEIVDVYQIENLEEFVKNRKSYGWCIVSTSAYLENKDESSKLAVSATEFKVTKPTVLILGNEGKGISETIQNLCDTLISIAPGQTLHQGIDSLNVSVAAGVLLYILNSMKNI